MPSLKKPAVPAGRLGRLLQPTLTVDELVVRPWHNDDAPAVLAAYRDPEICRWHAARGGAIATRVLDAVSRWTFTVVGLHRLQLDHSTANHASCKVAERAGFRLEGTRRGQALHEDGWHDMHVHGRLATD